MLWHIELKFCTWLCFNVLQIKFECRHFASLWTYNIGKVQFSALFFYMLRYIELKFCIWLCFTILQIKFECCQFPSIFVGVMPLLECRILKIQFSALFSYTLWLIELKICISLCFTVLQIKFECRQFASIFVGVMPLLELRILEIKFSALFSYMHWHIELQMFRKILFYCTTDQVKELSICVNFCWSYAPFGM